MEKEKVTSHDVNKECGKTKDSSADGLITSDKQQETKLGQWSTAKFNDNNRQEKFLRLMGGKKAVGKKTGLWSGKTTFANAAMDQTESRKLATKLEGQFQNALEFNLQKRNENNRTKGLGFVEDPAKGKKFHIDINKTNSVKFN
uniref:Small acidic protein-like domain-containing protein n=2 Tax=Ciona intestinalis TaxID=7719 RepID=F6QHF4_CIOIN